MLHKVYLQGLLPIILIVVFNLKKSWAVKQTVHYVSRHADQTANISPEVAVLAWDWIRHGWRALLRYEQRGKAMFPWLHIPGCEKIVSLNLTRDFRVRGQRHVVQREQPLNLSLYCVHKHTALNTSLVEYTTHTHTHTHTHTLWFLAIKEKIDITIFLLLSISAWSLSEHYFLFSAHKSICYEHITVKHIMESLPGQRLCISLSDDHKMMKTWDVVVTFFFLSFFVKTNITGHQSDY